MVIETVAEAGKRWLATNNNDANYVLTAMVPTLTEPARDGVIDLGFPNGGVVQNWMKLLFIGVGASNDAYSVRIYGWMKVGGGDNPQVTWVPVPLVEFAVILGTAPGPTGGVSVLSTEKFADTVAAPVLEETTTANTTRDGSVYITSPGNDTVAHARFMLQGFSKLEAKFDQTTNTPTMNLLYALM